MNYVILVMLVILAWDAPTTNTDGTPLSDLAGYKLSCWNAGSDLWINSHDVGNVNTVDTVTFDPDSKCVYFLAVAYNAAGNESAFSNITDTFTLKSLGTVTITNQGVVIE
jgi:hypothetical protein